MSAGDRMVRTWLSWLGLRRTARKQNHSSMLASSECDSPTVCPTSETDETLASRKSQQDDSPGLATLSTELILISEGLPTVDAHCLALTCKRMRNIVDVSCSATPVHTDALDTLLCRLERDTTELTYCFIDQKLRPLRFSPTKWDFSHMHFHEYRSDLKRVMNEVPFFSIGLFMLDYCTARLVTNHQLIGPQHGFPASYLASIYKCQPFWHPWAEAQICESEEWAAKVIQGELFLSRIYTILHKEANADALRQYCNEQAVQIRRHMVVGGHHGVRLPEDIKGNTKQHFSGSCQKCEIDWELNIEWSDTERDWTVMVKTYHGLGACRWPQDQKWQALSVNRKADAYREVPGGAVKELWDRYKSQL